MPGHAQAALEAREHPLDVLTMSPEDRARAQFRAARDGLVEAIVVMLSAGLTIDDLMDECGVPRGGMRSAVRAMVGRYSADDLIAALDAQKAS